MIRGPAHGDVPRAPHNQNPALGRAVSNRYSKLQLSRIWVLFLAPSGIEADGTRGNQWQKKSIEEPPSKQKGEIASTFLERLGSASTPENDIWRGIRLRVYMMVTPNLDSFLNADVLKDSIFNRNDSSSGIEIRQKYAKNNKFGQRCVWIGYFGTFWDILGHFRTIRKTFRLVWSIQTVFLVISDHLFP